MLSYLALSRALAVKLGQVLSEIIHLAVQVPVEIDATKTAITHYAASTRDGIGSAIRWLKGSELNLLRSRWLNKMSGMNHTLSKLISLIDSPPNTIGHWQLSLVAELDSFHHDPPSQPVPRSSNSCDFLQEIDKTRDQSRSVGNIGCNLE
ncbi:hypothetical protein PGTUg99_029470 [Puccinia graminis f. sp. tritici]|uniref:Uncharacterized protein n=1 Tax=Puccinia graminis f. sp. tritici TaxID=56615 RepID=A0A5B0SL91_PUCGR|nr:hypothetical protein PGTUg99_029470 [Puccinia graminis f. sp. tritici]